MLTTIDRLLESVRDDMERVEQILLSSSSSDILMLGDICKHILSSGGKRLRPLIVLLTARFCGYAGDKHIPLACALEYIHTATLLHDDVIDHAEMRRGSSSAHTLWGNQATILAGDFFLSRAFSMAVEARDLRILDVIARTSTCLAEAETYQVAKAGDPLISEAEYFFIIKNKTAGLIAAAARIGGMLGGIPAQQEQALEAYGLNLGIAFQIMDDVLDYYSSEKEFGKTIGKDLQEGSITLPFIAALSKSSSPDRDLMMDIIQRRNHGKEELALIVSLIEKYNGSAYAFDKARYYAQQAQEALIIFDGSENKNGLLELAEYVVERKF